MSPSDDRAPTGGAYPDEGTIHEWLDGALDAAEAAALEALVASDAAFAARVAEARGLVAASSRIVSALDDAPSARDGSVRGAAPIGGRASSTSTRVAPRVRGPSWRAFGSVAAVLLAFVSGVWVLRDDVPDMRGDTAVAADADAPMPEATAVTGAEPSPAISSEAVAAVRALARSRPAADSTLVDRASRAAVSTPPAAVRDVPSAARPAAPPPALAAARAAERSDVARSDVAAGRQFTSESSGERMAASLGALDESDDALFAMRRLLCTDRCVLTRIRVLADGATTIDGGESTRRVVLADTTRTRLRTLADSLDVRRAAWPFTGRTCGSVSALRSSLAVTVPGPDGPVTRQSIPWCPDASHPIDRFAAALADAARAANDVR